MLNSDDYKGLFLLVVVNGIELVFCIYALDACLHCQLARYHIWLKIAFRSFTLLHLFIPPRFAFFSPFFICTFIRVMREYVCDKMRQNFVSLSFRISRKFTKKSWISLSYKYNRIDWIRRMYWTRAQKIQEQNRESSTNTTDKPIQSDWTSETWQCINDFFPTLPKPLMQRQIKSLPHRHQKWNKISQHPNKSVYR